MYLTLYFFFSIDNITHEEELSECSGGFDLKEGILLLEDLYARLGNVAIQAITRRPGVPGIKENWDKFVELCAEKKNGEMKFMVQEKMHTQIYVSR